MQGTGNRDIIVIGGSAGAFEPLRRLVADLPAGLPAAVFVALHTGSRSVLPKLLDAAGPLPAAAAVAGEPIEPGRIYVAPPDLHLLLHDGHVLLRRGPRENLARPAVDALFRAAAIGFGGRVVGVVLSGMLNDGTAGLDAIRRCGGIGIVQEPAEALWPAMPASAVAHGLADHRAPAERLGPLLDELVRQPAGADAEPSGLLRLEAAIAAQELADMAASEELGRLSPLTCPDCGGVLWEMAEGGTLRFRCHVGHAVTADVALAAQGEAQAALLRRLVRGSRERAALARRLADADRSAGRAPAAATMARRALDCEEDAETARRLLERFGGAET